MNKKRAQILSTLFLFTSLTPGAGFFIRNKDNAHSVGVAYFMLHCVKFIKLFSRKFCEFSASAQKIISLYNVYIIYTII